MSLLKQYRNQQLEQRLKLGIAWKNKPYIFILDDGTPISPNLPYKWFVDFLNRHNLPKITFHQLRHTNVSILIASGEDVVTVSARLGHANKNITLNTYSHLIKWLFFIAHVVYLCYKTLLILDRQFYAFFF